MKKEKIGSKTKGLWANPEYRKHMSEVHKGQKVWNKGIKLIDQIDEKTNELRKLKISETLKKLYQEGKRTSNWINREYPLSARIKQSEACKGNKHWNWQGGKTKKRDMHSLNIVIWRKAVFERDNYTCQNCIKIGGKLRAHHIKSWREYPELRFDISNGKTLCLKCHNEVHRKC